MHGPRSRRPCSVPPITGPPTSTPLSGAADGAIASHVVSVCSNTKCHIDLADAPVRPAGKVVPHPQRSSSPLPERTPTIAAATAQPGVNPYRRLKSVAGQGVQIRSTAGFRFKGKRSDLPRAARKRGGQAAKRGLSAEQIPILVARDRSGATTDAVLPKLNRASITVALQGVVTSDNQLCCDGGKAIVGFARKRDIPCQILPSPGGPRPEAPNLHINNVNGYHSRLKEWLRPFHGVATQYLDLYLGWRRTIEAWRHGAQPADWLLSAVGIAQCQ